MPVSPKSFSTILTLLLLVLSSPAQAAFFVSPIVELKLVDVSMSAVKPMFSWQTYSFDPIDSHFLYIDVDKNKIFTDSAAIYKNVGSGFNYQLSDAEQLNERQLYYWGIKAIDSKGAEGFSEISAFDPLILKYEPILYFHPEENFYPVDAESFVLYSSLWDSKGKEPDVQLGYEYDLTLNDLTPEGADTSGWYLQFVEDLALSLN